MIVSIKPRGMSGGAMFDLGRLLNISDAKLLSVTWEG